MKQTITKVNRDIIIQNCLEKFKICSRNQLARLIFSNNTNPINVCNRVMKRLVLTGKVLPVPRTKDQCYLYTNNPSPIHHGSNKINHALKIVDYYIENPSKQFLIEPVFGSYEPDIFYKDKQGKSICVEIQLTPISQIKMQLKINQYVREYGILHDSQTLYICSNKPYNLNRTPRGFTIINKPLPKDVIY